MACVRYNLAPRSVFMKQCGQISVNLHNRLLSRDDVKPIAAALMSDKATTHLDLSCNCLGLEGARQVGTMMVNNRQITVLNLSTTQLGRAGLEALANSLCENSTLHTLHLDSNNLQGCDEQHIVKLIMKMPYLRELYLGHNKLGSPSITHLAQALEEVTCQLNVLDLQYNHIRREAAARLVQSLARNRSLHTVNLAWNGLATEGCVELGRVLTVNAVLRHLDLTHTRICAQDIQLLTPALRTNSTLLYLKLCSNPITNVGAKTLATALLSSRVSALRALDLRGIPVDEDFVFLANRLEEQNSIRVVYDVTGTLLPLRTVVAPWPVDHRDIGFYRPVLVLFEYMKLDGMRLVDLFGYLDHHKRGQISMNDLRRGIHEMLIPFSEHALEELMRCMDTNKDGFISFDELLQAYRDHYCVLKRRKSSARLGNRPDGGLRDLWAILRDIIRRRRPGLGGPSNAWYTLMLDRWKL